MKEEFLTFCTVALIIIALLVGVIYLSTVTDRARCNSRFGSFEHKWGYWSGCLIQVDGKWIPSESYYVKEDFK